MAELVLRGRQTVGELRARASRMASFQDSQGVAAVLQGLAAHEPPFVEELPREPGRSANRFRHLLSAEDADTAAASLESFVEVPGQVPDVTEGGLVRRVADLEARVAELTRIVDELRSSPGRPAGTAV
jgi:uncharacterized protein YceH (UPF0502 family)